MLPDHANHASNEPVPAERPRVAIINNAQAPYRTHVFRRLVREIPEARFYDVYTHVSALPWAFETAEELRPVQFGENDPVGQQSSPGRSAHEWRKGGRIIRWLIENDIRAVVLIGYGDAGRLRILRWCHRRGIPCMLFGDSNIRGDRARGIRRMIKRAVLGWVVRRCSILLPCGSLGMAYFQRYGASPQRMRLFPYEPDYDLIRNVSDTAIAQVAARFGLRKGRRRIIYSGRFATVKRVDLLLNAFARLAKERPEWDLVLAGDGPLRKELLESYPIDLRGRLVWTGGFLGEQADVSALYRLCDVLVLPSDYEPWAVVVNEAAAAGLALVCSDVVGAAEELVRDGVNGRIFSAGDLHALRQALLGVTDPSAIDAMKAASAQVLEDWRRRADPVAGMRAALEDVRVLC